MYINYNILTFFKSCMLCFGRIEKLLNFLFGFFHNLSFWMKILSVFFLRTLFLALLEVELKWFKNNISIILIHIAQSSHAKIDTAAGLVILIQVIILLEPIDGRHILWLPTLKLFQLFSNFLLLFFAYLFEIFIRITVIEAFLLYIF